jgi:hypothetical protein
MENLSTSMENGIQLDNEGLHHLSTTRKWAMFLSILGFVFIGLMLLVAGTMIFVGGMFPRMGFGAVSMLPVILIIAIYFFPIYYLYNFSWHSKKAATNKDKASLNIALKYLKMHYRFMGIFAIIALSIYAIVLVTFMIRGSYMHFFS